MKLKIPIVVLVCLLALACAGKMQAQTPKQKLNNFLDKAEAHKVYVQLDRDKYFPGEDIFYKAYVVKAGSHTPVYTERMLYVELYTQMGSLVNKQLVKIENGVAIGQLTLDAGIALGEYTLVAYTNWLKNFEHGAAFSRKLYIVSGNDNDLGLKLDTRVVHKSNGDSVYVDVQVDAKKINQGEATELSSALNLKNDDSLEGQLNIVGASKGRLKLFVPTNDVPEKPFLNVEVANGNISVRKTIPLSLSNNKPDIQVLPEGGTLVGGLQNKVGIAATDVSGKALEYTGMVTERGGAKVADFVSKKGGITSCSFVPAKGKKYVASIKLSSGQTFGVDLPEVKEGVKITATLNSQFGYDVKIENTSSKLTNLICLGYNADDVFLTKDFGGQNSLSFTIDEGMLPVGASRIMIIANNEIPVGERMLFRYPTSKVGIKIDAHKPEYKTREQVKMGIIMQGGNADYKFADMAVSVVEDGSKAEVMKENIMSYLLMNSELKGNIVDPGWYVTEKSLEKAKLLDLVLLTHGWSRFDVEKILSEHGAEMPYARDSMIYFKGQVRNNLTKSPLKERNIAATILRGEKAAYANLVSDNKGYFNMNLGEFYQDFNLVLSFTNKKKQHTDVFLEIETPFSAEKIDLISLNAQKYFDDKAYGYPAYPALYNTKIFDTDEQNGQQGLSMRKLKKKNEVRTDSYYSPGGDTISLPSIDVVEKKIVGSRAQFLDKYGVQPDAIIETQAIRKLAEQQKNYTSVWDLVLDEIPGLDYSYEYIPACDTASTGYDLQDCADRKRILKKARENNSLVIWPTETSQAGYTSCDALLLRDVCLVYVNNKVVSYVYDLNSINPKDVIAIEFIENPPFVNDDDLRAAYRYLSRDEAEAGGFLASEERITMGGINQWGVKNSLISITLKSGSGFGAYSSKGVYRGKLKGFEKYREFYVPNYGNEEISKGVVSDMRKTVYWNPDVKLMKNQPKMVSFYTSDSKKPMQVVVEGITNNGIPFFATRALNVEGTGKKVEAESITVENKLYNAYARVKPGGVTPKKVHVMVVNKDQKEPVRFATALVLSDNYGQVTNEDGEMVIPLRKGFSGLLISYPGYESVKIPAAEITADSLLVELKAGGLKPLNANDEMNVTKLMREAIRDIGKNFPMGKAHNAFYVEKVYQDGWICAINESMVNYTCESDARGNVSADLEWEKYRSFKTFDYREKVKFEPNHQAENFVVNSDPVNNRALFLLLGYMDWYEYKIIGKELINGRICYVVKFDQKKDKIQALQKGTLYIDATSKALVRAKWQMSPRGLQYATYPLMVNENFKYRTLEPLESNYESTYRLGDDGKYYLLACTETIGFSVDRSYTMMFDKTLLVNQTHAKDDYPVKPNKIEELNKKTFLIKSPVYSGEFWDRYLHVKASKNVIDNMKYLHEESIIFGK